MLNLSIITKEKVIKIYGIYAHRNKIDNAVFYVGKQIKNNVNPKYIRSEDFEKERSEEYKKYVEKIGTNNIEVIWLYKTNDENIKLNKLEKHFQELYYDIYREKFLCYEFVAYGNKNPNFGNYWSEEKKQRLSKLKKDNNHGKGKNNSRATKCMLHFPSGETKNFDYLGQMKEWFWNNITDNIKIDLQENEFKELKYSCIPKRRREAYKKSIGFYYTRV